MITQKLKVFGNGNICLSLINESKDWKPSITIKQILIGIQELLDSPNPNDPAHPNASKLYNHSKNEYIKKVKQQAQKYNN